MKKIVRDGGYRGKEAISQAANIAKKLSTYRAAKADYVIFDEGLTQSAISLTQNGVGDPCKIEASLYALCDYPNVKKVFIKVDLATALSRMASRSTNDSRIEKLQSNDEKLQALAAFETACNAILPSQVNSEPDAEVAAKQLFRQL